MYRSIKSLLCAASVIAAPVALSQQPENSDKQQKNQGMQTKQAKQQGDSEAERANRDLGKKMRQVSGEVIKKKEVGIKNSDKKNVIVMLKTNKASERLLVDLSSSKEMKNIKVGDQISVEGKIARLSGQRVLIASRVKHKDKVQKTERGDQEQSASNQGYQGTLYAFYVLTTTDGEDQIDRVITENTELDENLQDFIGKRVLVRGEVSSAKEGDDRLFEVDYDGLIGMDEVLVLAPENSTGITNDNKVEVIGTVQKFDRESFKKKHKLNLDGDKFTDEEYVGAPIIVADEVSDFESRPAAE